MGDFVINYILGGMVLYQLGYILFRLIRNVPRNYCRHINYQLRNFHKERYEWMNTYMRPFDPRIYAKWKWRLNQKTGFLGTHSYELTRRQEWSCFFRAMTFRDRYASFTDTQRWMLGVKEPYFPVTNLTRLYLARMPWKVYSAPINGKRLAERLLAGDLLGNWSHHIGSKTYLNIGPPSV